MSAADDLAAVIRNAGARPGLEDVDLTDAILAAGWVPRDRAALVRDSVREVSRQRADERDALAATVERVRAVLDDWCDRGAVGSCQGLADDLRDALAPPP